MSELNLRQMMEQARINEQIQGRLDQVDAFLLAQHGLKELLRHLPARMAQIYALEAVTLCIASDNQRLQDSLGPDGGLEPPAGCYFRERKDIRVILGDLERPYLSNKLIGEVKSCFFPEGPFLASMAVMPLWVRGEFLGTFNLGSASPKRYTAGLETDFLQRLARKIATGLDAALLMEQTKLMERGQAAVEMAGAACHELAQPLQTMEFLVNKLGRVLAPGAPGAKETGELARELERTGELVKKISQVGQYVTRPYAGGMSIIDVEAAAEGGDEKE